MPLMTLLLPHCIPDFADLFKHLFVTCGQCCVGRLNKRGNVFNLPPTCALCCQIDVTTDIGSLVRHPESCPPSRLP